MKTIIVIMVLMIIVYAFWFFAVQVGSVNVSNFKGDGQIKKIGQGFLAKGVELELPSVNSNHMKFSIKDLPATKREYFVFTDLHIDSHSSIRIAIKIIGKADDIINAFEINSSNSVCTSFENNAQVCYTPNGVIPKDKVSAADSIIIDRIDSAGSQALRIFLRSGGGI